MVGVHRVVVVEDLLSCEDFAAVSRGQARLEVGQGARHRLAVARDRMAACLTDERLVYGVTTGFGPLADRTVPGEQIEELQRNLIYHLASGVGAPLGFAEARALMLARLVSMTRGWSGASTALVDLMVACLDAGLAPFIPEKGTVGASGDLTPSAHMALALMGEGAFVDRDGAVTHGPAALTAAGLAPYKLDGRDGLALVNGTSCMTGIAALTAVDADRLASWSIALTAMHAEALSGLGEAWHPAFGEARPHPGQIAAIERLSRRLEGSERIERQRIAERRVRMASPDEIVRLPVTPQDPYSIRCAPQIIGAALDVIDDQRDIVETELNAATDNPIFEPEAPYALHGGNFYGQHVAFASDMLNLATIKLAILAERQIARLTDERMSRGLPAFLQPHRTGLHSGFMGAQVTASALLAEVRTRAIPGSIQSIPTNGNNQDVVSMGTIAARNAAAILGDVWRILSIQALALAQALDLHAANGSAGYSRGAHAVHRFVRRISRKLEGDRPLAPDIAAVAAELPHADPDQLN